MPLPADTLIVDTDLLIRFQTDGRYDYGRDFRTPDRSILAGLQEWLSRSLQSIGNSFDTMYLWIALGLVVLGFTLWLVWKNQPRIFTRDGKAGKGGEMADEDNIYGIDFEGLLEEALGRADYRQAVRLVYLQTLRLLADAQRIDWQLYKTPTEYTREITTAAFRRLTDTFVRVRYGNFEATEATCKEMLRLQHTVREEACI